MTVNFKNTYTPTYDAVNCTKTAQPSFGKKINPKILSNKTAGYVEGLGVNFDSAMQRGLMGVLAFFTQPFIDKKNKNVDEETRKASSARTTAKIIAGTTTGVIIREGLIQLTKMFSKNDNILEYEFKHKKANIGKTYIPKVNFKKYQQILLETANDSAEKIKRTRNAIGTIAAIVVMLYTNFAIDAPLTTFLTNKLYKPSSKEDKQ